MHKFAVLRRRGGPAIRLAVFYVAIFFIVGSYISFLPLWLSAAGLDAWQISLIYALPVMLRPVFTTTLSYIADRSGNHVGMLRLLALGAFLSVTALPFIGGFPAIITAFTLFALFWTTVVPLTEAVALGAARNGTADYGRVRLWGSLSYIAIILAGGAAVDMFGPPAALWLFIGAAASVVLAALWLPDMNAVNGASADTPLIALRGIRFADLAALLRVPVLWLFLAATSAVQATHAVYYVFGTIHWTAIGIAPTVIGALWSIGVVAEIVLFAYAARVARSFGPVQLILIGAVAALIRWTVTSFDPPLAALFGLQLLHGLTFGATHLGAMQFMTRAFPPHMAATVQGIYASFSAGLVMGSAYLAAGPLYRSFGGAAYLGMAAISVVAIAFSLLLWRRWSGGSVLSSPQGG